MDLVDVLGIGREFFGFPLLRWIGREFWRRITVGISVELRNTPSRFRDHCTSTVLFPLMFCHVFLMVWWHLDLDDWLAHLRFFWGVQLIT